LFKLNYTYTNAVDKSKNSPDFGKKLLRRPIHRAALFIDYIISDRADVNLELIYVGKKDDKNFSTFPAQRINLDSYTLLNIAGHYSLLKFLSLFARVENLLDTDYEEVYGYGTPGFSVFAGIKLNLI
jgi:vitamin B12 transporter